MKFLFFIEQGTRDTARDSAVPSFVFSHDRYALQIAHEVLRKGFKIYFATVGINPNCQTCFEAVQIFPTWKIAVKSLNIAELNPDVVVGVNLHTLGVHAEFPTAKIVAAVPAIYMAENIEVYARPQYTHKAGENAQSSIDFILVQNPRMGELLLLLLQAVSGWYFPDRILIAPSGIVPEQKRVSIDRSAVRRKMGLSKGDVAIVNSGGIWKWTDFNSFLRAYIKAVHNGCSNLKLYIMGFQQSENSDHDDYIAETKSLLSNNKTLLRKNIIAFDSWLNASAVVSDFTLAADVGLNVNQDTIEHWQSQRVRFLEYVASGIPVINTSGDYLSAYVAENAVFQVRAGNINDYLRVLKQISKNPEVIRRKRAAMKSVAKRMQTPNLLGPIIDDIVRRERPKHPLSNPPRSRVLRVLDKFRRA